MAVVIKAERLASMVALFGAGRPWHVGQLAERFGARERTIQRDILTLQCEPFGLPLLNVGPGTYRVMSAPEPARRPCRLPDHDLALFVRPFGMGRGR